MKKLIVMFVMVLTGIVFAGSNAAACGPGEPCNVTAIAAPNVTFQGYVPAVGSNLINGGGANGDFTISGLANASGRDTWKTKHVWVSTGPRKHQGYWKRTRVLVPGTATAVGIVNPELKSDVVILTNGIQTNGGLSYSYVTSTSALNIKGEVWAKGNRGCLQTAEISVEGSIGAFAYGGSGVEGLNGAFASADGYGLTTVGFSGYESDQSKHGIAYVDFDSLVTVDQSILNMSYVSPDGTTAANFAMVGGGSAKLNLGRDGCFGRDNIHLTNIESSGAVAQNGMAANGKGAFAYGGSSAQFSGANGNPWSICSSRISPTYRNVGGVAIASGYNNITETPGSISITSKQYAYASTGNNAYRYPDGIDVPQK